MAFLKAQAVSDASVTGVELSLADQSLAIRRFSLTSAFFTGLFGTFHFMRRQGRIRATFVKSPQPSLSGTTTTIFQIQKRGQKDE
jgi:hypothetical protein